MILERFLFFNYEMVEVLRDYVGPEPSERHNVPYSAWRPSEPPLPPLQSVAENTSPSGTGITRDEREKELSELQTRKRTNVGCYRRFLFGILSPGSPRSVCCGAAWKKWFTDASDNILFVVPEDKYHSLENILC